MVNTLEEKIELINKELEKNESNNPLEIVQSIMDRNFINIHGPEHHYLDGASFLVAYKNAGGNIDLEKALEELQIRTKKCLEQCVDYGESVVLLPLLELAYQ